MTNRFLVVSRTCVLVVVLYSCIVDGLTGRCYDSWVCMSEVLHTQTDCAVGPRVHEICPFFFFSVCTKRSLSYVKVCYWPSARLPATCVNHMSMYVAASD